MEQIKRSIPKQTRSDNVKTSISGTIEKALDVLFHLHEAGSPLGVTTIARTLGMPKSSVHRLLSTLARRELVEQNERGQYQIGVGLMALGLGVLAREPVAVAAHPVLERAAAEVGETFFLVVARAGRLIVLDKAEGNGFLRAAPQVGTSVPVHATAVGKLYLLHAPEQVQLAGALMENHPSKNKQVFETAQLPRYTDNTLIEWSDLQCELERVRRQGWASNLDEWQSGLSVLAAPVLLGTRLLGAVALALVSPRLQELGLQTLAQRVVYAAEGIALRLEGKK